jgi:hypothetical protein
MANDRADDAATGGPSYPPIYLGPYEYWNFGIGKGYAFPAIRQHARYLTALAELTKAADQNDMANTQDGQRTAWFPILWNAADVSFVPFVLENPLSFVDGPEALRSLLGEGLLGLLNVGASKIRGARARVAFPVPEAAMRPNQGRTPEEPAWQPDTELRDRLPGNKRITIVGIIDDGLPFAHRHFRDATGTRTRVEFCLLQSAVADPQQKSVLFGREYTRSDINGYIARFGHDEDNLYREAGALFDPEAFGSLLSRHTTHGCHVMDLATGYGAERGENPPEEIRVIGVQLPNTIAWDTSGFGKDMYMLAAFHYIFHRADIIARGYGIEKPRLVLNLSYGYSGGRHDGGTELEAAIDELVAARRRLVGPTALVIPSGNTFLDRLHAIIREEDFAEQSAKLFWRLQPNGRTPSYLELWFPKQADASRYTVECVDPTGRVRVSLPIRANPAKPGGDPRVYETILNTQGKPVGLISADFHRADLWRVLVALAPTEPDDSSLPGSEPGKWTIVVKRDGSAAPLQHPIQCWIQRASDPESLRSGSRQSYFDHSDYVLYTPEGDLSEQETGQSMVRRFGTLNGLATGSTPLVVAGYRGTGVNSAVSAARPALYSSAGDLEAGWPDAKVACSSMADRSRVMRGTIAAGVRSGSRSQVYGTSTAAPFVTRQLAEAFTVADDASVEMAAAENYRPLLRGYREAQSPDGGDDAGERARLGLIRVPPHWQPGFDHVTEDR